MRYFFPNLLCWLVLCLVLVPFSVQPQELDLKLLAAPLVHAKANHELMPNISSLDNLSLSQAYQVQVFFVREQLKSDKIVGYKAGLTSHQAQDSIGMDRPIFGVLLKNGDLSRESNISLKQFHNLNLEIELGFILNRSIKHVIHSVDELKQYVERVVPVVEMPDLGFQLGTYNLIDLIASNAAFSAYVFEPNINWLNDDLNSICISLLHDGTIVTQGDASDTLGDQWEALRWLINQVILHGWSIEKGHLLITGTLGEIIPARTGSYCAKFNNQNCIQFTITD